MISMLVIWSLVLVLETAPQGQTRQDKRPTEVEGNPKAPFSIASAVTGIYRKSRQGWAPLVSRCMHNLSPVILVLILPTTNEWKAEWTLEQRQNKISCEQCCWKLAGNLTVIQGRRAGKFSQCILTTSFDLPLFLRSERAATKTGFKKNI